MNTSCIAEFERKHVVPNEGRTLIVGSYIASGKADRRARYAKALGVDMRPGPGVDLVADLEEPLSPDLGRFAHIECCSVLEHSRRPWLMAKNIEKLLCAQGTLYLTVPFVWRFHSYPSDYFRYTAEGVRSLFPGIRWKALMYASDRLRPDHFLNSVEVDGYPYLPRTEVVGFGVRA